MISAHRGIPYLAPENTIPSLVLAERTNTDFIEFDIHKTKDNKIVLIHDSTLNRTTNGSGVVESYSSWELSKLDAGSWFSDNYRGVKIPFFEDALRVLESTGKILIIDVKSRGIETQVLDMLEEFKLIRKCVVASHISDVLIRFRDIAIDVPRMLITSSITSSEKVISIIEPLVVAPTIKRAVTEDSIMHLHELGIFVNVGIINSTIEAEAFVRMGADIISTDKAHILVKYRENCYVSKG